MSHTGDETRNLKGETRLHADETWLHANELAVNKVIYIPTSYSSTIKLTRVWAI